MNVKIKDETKSKQKLPPYPAPTESMYSRKNRVSFSTSDRATKRVIAPYVKIVRKSKKSEATIIQEEVVDEHFAFYLKKKPSLLTKKLSSFLSDNVDLPSLLHETADVLKLVTKSTAGTIYMVDEALNEIYQSPRIIFSERHKVNWKIELGKTIAQYVAYQKEYVLVDDIIEDERFPEGIGYKDEMAKAVLCAPIVTPEGSCFAVLQLYRTARDDCYSNADVKIVIALCGWMGAAIHQNQQRIALQKQQELNDYLLNLTKCFFANTATTEKLISEIVSFAKTTLNAERGSFYIIDRENTDLVADLYEEGIDENDNQLHKRNLKVKLYQERGVATLVAQTGEIINIIDAYNDERFNPEIDEKTGLITRSILCMPIMGVDGILGVVQMVNKIDDPCFTQSDENLFRTISVYCALALHYSQLQNLMQKAHRSNTCLTRLVKYHIKPCSHDLVEFIRSPFIKHVPDGFNGFDWYITPDLLHIMPQLSMYMIIEIVGESEVNIDYMAEFVLSVRKSYRNNYYHNYEHAFNVCHSIYNMLRLNLDQFSPLELKALMVSALCHDLDHGGFTNNFLQLTNDTLAQLYDEAPLENHHFQVTLNLINDAKIFNDISKHEYRELIEQIKYCILATDLPNYFRSRTRLLQINRENAIDWSNENHRYLIKAIMMTAADLSGQCKPYSIAKRITNNLYREFYHQGDIEKQMGYTPLSMMDREKQYLIPEDQVQFLSVVVLPCVTLLQSFLPSTSQIVELCIGLRDVWREIIELRDQKIWRQEDSLVIIQDKDST